MSLKTFAWMLLLGVSAPMALGQEMPPTVDPTYGMKIPKPVPQPKAKLDANWIWAKQVSDNQTIYVRKEFHLNSLPSDAKLYITADNIFTAYVNGEEVSSTPIDPTDVNLWQRVQAVNISANLKKGINVIAIKVQNLDGAAGLLARLEVDSKPYLLSDKSWKVSQQTPLDGWQQTGFQDKKWDDSTVEGPVGTGPWADAIRGWPVSLQSALPNYLFHLPIQPVRWAYAGDPDGMDWHSASEKMSFDRPNSDTDNSDWRVIFDFGKEVTGRVLATGSPAMSKIGTGESTGEVLNQPYTTSTSGATPYASLRYTAITVPGDTQHVDLDVQMDHLYYPVQYLGSFDCSDPLLTKIWYTGAYTAHLCMQQDIWDAPKRDRVRWMGDMHVSGEVINNVFADKFLMEHTMSLLRADAQGGKPDSELPVAYVNGIPGYSAAWFAGLADFYRHSGDRKYLLKQHEAIISMLKFCEQDFNDHGIFVNNHHSWIYTDWSQDLFNDSDVSRATTEMFLIKGVDEAVFLLNNIGDTLNATKYLNWSKELKIASQKKFLDSNGLFGTRKQENAMAIYSGVADSSQVKNILNSGILSENTGTGDSIVSPYYGNYLLRAMTMGNHTQDGLNYIRTFWGQMVKDGATTFYETYDPSWEKQNFHAHLQWDDHNNASNGYHVSLCHGWSAGPTNYLTECVLGIQSTGAGFKTCTITPSLGDLSWATGVVPTPHGSIKVRVDRTESGQVVKITIPSGVTAKVTITSTITTVDGKSVSSPFVELGSGHHVLIGV